MDWVEQNWNRVEQRNEILKKKGVGIFSFFFWFESNFEYSIRFGLVSFKKKRKRRGGGRDEEEVVDWHPMIDSFVPVRLLLLSSRDTTLTSNTHTLRVHHFYQHLRRAPLVSPPIDYLYPYNITTTTSFLPTLPSPHSNETR